MTKPLLVWLKSDHHSTPSTQLSPTRLARFIRFLPRLVIEEKKTRNEKLEKRGSKLKRYLHAINEKSELDTETMPCLLTHISLISGPAVALVYAISVWITYAVTHECQWGSKAKTLSLRLAIVTGAVACSVGFCKDKDETSFAVILPMGFALWAISLYLMYLTRVEDVVGIACPPFYGKDHLQGKVVLITGANQGIGKETTLQMAKMGATVVLLCRSEIRARNAIEDLVKKHAVDEKHLLFCSLDLGDFTSVRKAVEYIQTTLRICSVDVLICNAGLMMGKKTLSKDGHELMMQANHLGHFLLARLLVNKKLLKGDNVRILNLTSSTYELSKQGFDFDDMFCDSSRSYTLFGQYSMTKLANMLCAKELTRRIPSAKVFAIHPGVVRTNVTSNMNWYWRLPNAMFAYFVAAIQKAPQEGAYSSVFCAAAPDDKLPPSGSYIINCRPYPTNEHADSPEDAKRLWEVSELLVGLKS